MTVTIDGSCTACGACLITCPTHALLPAPRRPLVVDQRCIDCWDCLEICPTGAISARGGMSIREGEPDGAGA